MKQIAILLLLPLMLTSCSSDEDSSNSSLTSAFFTINRNGQSIRQDNVFFVSLEMDDCSNSGFRLTATWTGNFIETSEFNFAPGIIAPTLKTDIDNNLEVTTNIAILEEGLGSVDCVSLYQFLPLYWEENFSVTLDDSADNMNNIVEISMISDDVTKTTYAIQGNYNLTYTDGEDYSVNITGEYVLHVDTLK